MREAHRLADLVPPMTDDEFESLVSDIAERGLLEPITLYEGKVLDGRNRDRACDEAGVEARYEEYEGDEPAHYVISRNLKRRQLTVSQLSAAAAEAEALPEWKAEARRRQGARNDLHKTSASEEAEVSRSSTEAGKTYGVSRASVERAMRVKDQDPDLFEKVKAGGTTVTAADAELRERAAKKRKREPKPLPAQHLPDLVDGTCDEDARCQLIEWFKQGSYVKELLDEGRKVTPHDDEDQDAIRNGLALMTRIIKRVEKGL